MARRKSKKITGEDVDPSSMKGYVKRYLEWIQVLNYTERTVKNQRINLGYFLKWCEEREILSPSDVTREVLMCYQRRLYNYRSENGKPLCFGSQVTRLTPVRGFFKWLSKNNLILYNPAAELDLPKAEKRLPKHILTVREVERVLGGVVVQGPLGIRDRAILETLYSTGIRRMELISLKIYDMDSERGTILVHGKGRKDRTVPIGERAALWIEKYISDARPLLSVEPDDGTLFLTNDGDRLSENRLSDLAGRYVAEARIGKTGACHLFRHTMATHMLEGGADIRFVQEMLGHEELNTTKKYTRVSSLN
jgi:integrase/recombinase XerD